MPDAKIKTVFNLEFPRLCQTTEIHFSVYAYCTQITFRKQVSASYK